MTLCVRCRLKRGQPEDKPPVIETPRCDRCDELGDEEVTALLSAVKQCDGEWDDGTVTIAAGAFAAFLLKHSLHA